jgi:large subunit ribosomal protein L35
MVLLHRQEKEIGGKFMAKMKSSRTMMKRIKITKSGKLKRKKAYTGHLAPNKTRKQRKHLAKATLINKRDQQRLMPLVSGHNK